MEDTFVLEVIILIIVLIALRFFYLVHKIATGCSAVSTAKRTKPVKTMICIGSGGHTREIIELVSSLDLKKYSPRYYMIANNDITSQSNIEDLESPNRSDKTFRIIGIPRSRVVGQSFITSIFTTLYSIFYCVPILLYIRPDLILCNGPGTCIPICVISFILKAAFICDTRIIFVESFCRTANFSLSGKILRFIADNIVVQWPKLKKKLKRADYLGQLM